MLVHLMTCDRHTHEVDEVVWGECTTLKNLLEDIDEHDQVLPLPNVASTDLTRIIDFYKERASVDQDSQSIKVWEIEYVTQFTPTEMCGLMLAANYLAAEKCLAALARGVAASIQGKRPEEIRVLLNITNDFTPEEEEAIKKETAWAFV
jgi:S-phase kinase-associated protein 1